MILRRSSSGRSVKRTGRLRRPRMRRGDEHSGILFSERCVQRAKNGRRERGGWKSVGAQNVEDGDDGV